MPGHVFEWNAGHVRVSGSGLAQSTFGRTCVKALAAAPCFQGSSALLGHWTGANL
jgi:hypothetical protein